jgi:hypothetical protein
MKVFIVDRSFRFGAKSGRWFLPLARAAVVAGAGIGAIRLDDPGYELDQRLPLLLRESRHDPLVGSPSVRPEALAQGVALRRKQQDIGAPVRRVGLAVHQTATDKSLNRLTGGHLVDAKAPETILERF